jgi:hypothetical protein
MNLLQNLLAWLRRRRRPHELSIPLRALLFGAQSVGILAVAYTAQLWLVAALSLGLLTFGHISAYQAVKSKPVLWKRLFAFIGIHLVLGWMFVGLFTQQRYPQAQFAMLGMAIVSGDLFNRLNFSSALGMALATSTWPLPSAATWSLGRSCWPSWRSCSSTCGWRIRRMG